MEKLPLAGLTEIAQTAGVRKPVVSMWRRRHKDFPEPVAELHTGAVWWMPAVEAWLRATGRRTGAGWTVDQVRTREIKPPPKQRAQAIPAD